MRCKAEDITDGYGSTMSRASACRDPTAAVIVTVTDACPCDHENPSNKRWCCGDGGAGVAHLDLSVWAFERLAAKSTGVIAVEMRWAECNEVLENPADVPPGGPTGGEKVTAEDWPGHNCGGTYAAQCSDRKPVQAVKYSGWQ